jgi:protocatechuate 3,4-dioxygenase beta subunit
MTEKAHVELLAEVLARYEHAPNPRLREITEAAIRHLHAFVEEVGLQRDEWMTGIQFLTATGQMCDGARQEFILLSDTLGVSMLLDAINNRKPSGATESTVLGPFHVRGAPPRKMGDTISLDDVGEPTLVSGRVLDEAGQPIADAVLDVWQTSSDGAYDIQDARQPEMNLRGLFTTGADGRFFFRTVRPSSYAIPTDGPVGKMLIAMGRHAMRPAHIHFIVGAKGYDPVTTHIFVEGDAYLDSDAVFGVKDSLVEPFVLNDDAARATTLGLRNPFYTASRDFRLVRQRAV